MSKYIDADKLIAEIERQKSLFSTEKEKEGLSKTDKLSLGARIASLEETIVLINSLKYEQPEVDLDSKLSEFMSFYAYENNGEYPSAIDIAHYFYELRLNARKKK